MRKRFAATLTFSSIFVLLLGVSAMSQSGPQGPGQPPPSQEAPKSVETPTKGGTLPTRQPVGPPPTQKGSAFSQTAATCNPDAVKAYLDTFKMMGYLLTVLVVLVVVGLVIASFRGESKWSLGEALSEEAAYQPDPNKLRMVASSSRLIALLGLMGILVVVLGIGNAIIWNLFCQPSTPLDLDKISHWLFVAAALFAPYLANQLRSIFDPQPLVSEGAGKADAKTKDTQLEKKTTEETTGTTTSTAAAGSSTIGEKGQQPSATPVPSEESGKTDG